MESGCTTLADILEAGKTFSCSELLFILLKLVEGFKILQENGVANRDVKTQNIILVEDPNIEGTYYYKISDFGISCQLPLDTLTAPCNSVKGFTELYVAPEVLEFWQGNSSKENYNPFVADVYSLGLVTLKMINKLWGKKGLANGLLSKKEKFVGYESILYILTGMLEEDPLKRWDFKKLFEILQETEKNEAIVPQPTDIAHYYEIWQVNFK